MADPNKKFEEQIEDLLKSRLEDLEKYLKAYKGEKDDDEEEEIECEECGGVGTVENPDYVEPMSQGEAETELQEYPLSIEVRRYVDIDLSTGGPYDYLRYMLSEDNEVESVEYHAGWASDSAQLTYRGGSKFETLVEFFEFFKDGLSL